MNESPCPKCQSTESIPNVRIIDQSHNNGDFAATVFMKPDAMIFKTPIAHRFRARVCGVCGDCGYTELYVVDPKGLLAAAKFANSAQ